MVLLAGVEEERVVLVTPVGPLVVLIVVSTLEVEAVELGAEP